MDRYDPEEGSTSIAESSQEWHILNLLRVCERDLFETNLQEFRKIQLTESQDGKVRLCKLINEVLRLDPQYGIILVEDLSHLFNDSNLVVQKFALVSLADCFNILFTHIVASNGAVESYFRGEDLERATSQTCRCRTGHAYTNGQHRANLNHVAAPDGGDARGNPEGEPENQLAAYLDNPRVFESFADLACVRFMVHARLMEEDFADVKQPCVEKIPDLLYGRTRLYSVNLLKMLFYELANYPNYLCSHCIREGPEHPHNTANGDHEKPGKTTKPKERKKGKKAPAPEPRFDLYETLYRWHTESVQLLKLLIARYPHAAKTGKENKGARAAGNDGRLVGCILASEAASCLISISPDLYFAEFADLLVPLLATKHAAVFETIVFRILASSNCYKYHHRLIDKVNELGYNLELRASYKMAHRLPPRFSDRHRGNMVVVDRGDTGDRDKHFEVTDSLVAKLDVDFHDQLRLYPAAQLFEFDRELVRNYKNIKNSQIGINTNFYKQKPIVPTPLTYPPTDTDAPAPIRSAKHKGADDAGPGEGHAEPARKRELKTAGNELIAQNEQLFVRLVGAQMIDTVASYQRFVRLEMITPRVETFDTFAKLTLNRFLLSNIVEFERRREVLVNLLNYVAELVLLNHADANTLRKFNHTEQNTHGLRALFTYVNKTREVHLFVRYLNRLNDLVMYTFTTSLAKSLVSQRNKTEEHSKHRPAPAQDAFIALYEKFVNLCLEYLCNFIADFEEFGDFFVQALAKFVLNLPKIPQKIADWIEFWANSENEGNLKLAYSLVSHVLQLSATTKAPQRRPSLGYMHSPNIAPVVHSIFAVFLGCLTSDTHRVANMFLKLLSPQGLYNAAAGHSLRALQTLHEDFVQKLQELRNGCDKDKAELLEDALYLAPRPLWQWPKRLLELLSGLTELPQQLTQPLELKGDSGPDNGELDVVNDVGVWVEESFALMAAPNSVATATFIQNAVNTLISSWDASNNDAMEIDSDARQTGDENECRDTANEPQATAMKQTKYLEPMLACCACSPRLVFTLTSLEAQFPTEFYHKAAQAVSKYPKELEMLVKYLDQSPFIESVVEQTRKNWCGLLFKYDQRSEAERNLVTLLLSTMETKPDYLVQMAPFLSPDQLDTFMGSLFRKYDKDRLVRILDVIVETPKVSLPQHFLYSAYNLPVAALSNKDLDYMKLQVTLLDTCIMYCTLGKFSVESAISALYLIVESFESINSVFGRLLCQLVQKVPLTRKVIVDVIFPKLILKQCWQDKQLFRGVVITICTIWNQFRDQLVRYILEMPTSNVKTILRALHTQYNVADYFRSPNAPSNLRMIMEEVMASTTPTNRPQ